MCRTKLSLFRLAYSEIVVPFPFKLTYNCNKTTRRVTFMQKFDRYDSLKFKDLPVVSRSTWLFHVDGIRTVLSLRYYITSSRWRRHNCPRSFQCNSKCTAFHAYFHLKPRKIRHHWSQSGIPGSLLLRIWCLQSTAHLKPFPRNFFLYEHTCATLRAQVTRASKIWLWIFKACFTHISSSKIERSFGFDWFFSFRGVRFRSIVEFNRTQSMNWVRLSLIGFDWNLVRLGSIYYAGK